jgi:hypothetical protein
MKVNRRKTLGILAAVAAGARTASPQAAPPRPADATADAAVRTAREGFQSDAQRIAMVKLPQATEPAFQFHA